MGYRSGTIYSIYSLPLMAQNRSIYLYIDVVTKFLFFFNGKRVDIGIK